MALKVIGAGFGRTGTRSLKTALEELGFDRCYHMEEVLKNPSHLKYWAEIMEGGKADWENLFSGYQSATDWPAAAYYQELMVAYPEAKVILTVRDPERWHVSIMNTLYQASRKFRQVYTRIIPPLHQFLTAMEKVIWQGIFHNRWRIRRMPSRSSMTTSKCKAHRTAGTSPDLRSQTRLGTAV